jgi:hypothetical protein
VKNGKKYHNRQVDLSLKKVSADDEDFISLIL